MTITITRRRATLGIIAGLLVAALGLAACTGSSQPAKSAQSTGQAQTESAFAKQQAAVPYPASQLSDPLERRNLRERLLRYNQPNKISYLYLMSNTGVIYAYFTIKGKVSSNDSQMTTTDLVYTRCHYSNACNDITVPAPGDDGSYGPNERGMFAFTTDDVMVTWDTPYILTDAPLRIQTANIPLAYALGSKPTSTGR